METVNNNQGTNLMCRRVGGIPGFNANPWEFRGRKVIKALLVSQFRQQRDLADVDTALVCSPGEAAS